MGSPQRKQKLREILESILSGEFHLSSKEPDTYSPNRREYRSPQEISGFNWGATRIWEMGAEQDEVY